MAEWWSSYLCNWASRAQFTIYCSHYCRLMSPLTQIYLCYQWNEAQQNRDGHLRNLFIRYSTPWNRKTRPRMPWINKHTIYTKALELSFKFHNFTAWYHSHMSTRSGHSLSIPQINNFSDLPQISCIKTTWAGDQQYDKSHGLNCQQIIQLYIVLLLHVDKQYVWMIWSFRLTSFWMWNIKLKNYNLRITHVNNTGFLSLYN